MTKKSDKNPHQIHVRVNQNTREQWLEICERLSGNTQAAVFKKLISKIYETISEISNIKSYEGTD